MIFSLYTLLDSLMALFPRVTEDTVRKQFRFECKWNNTLAVATNTAIPEQPLGRVKQKCRLVALNYVPGAAITGTATDFFTLIVRKRTAATPGTQVAIASFAADTPTTDNVAAFASKDLFVTAYLNNVAAADLDFAEGDIITAEVTKSTATGMTYPVGTVSAIFEGRD